MNEFVVALESTIRDGCLMVRANDGEWFLVTDQVSRITDLRIARDGVIGHVTYLLDGKPTEHFLTIIGAAIRVSIARPVLRKLKAFK